MENQTVSIIIPSYNRAHLLPKVIPSYVQERVCEIIIVDDKSTDNTEEIVNMLKNDFPIIRYYKSEKKIRQTGAKNIGIQMAKGVYCYFGDDDSILKEGSIESLVNNAILYPNSLMATRHILMNNEQDLNELLLDTNILKFFDINTFYNKNTLRLYTSAKISDIIELPFCQACFLIQTKVAKTQKFNESFVGTCYREETDYIMQLCQKGHKVYLDNNALSIDLPRQVSSGGTRSVGFLMRHLGEAYNEFLFYKRNRIYLKKVSTMNSNPLIRAYFHLSNKVLSILKSIDN